MGFVTQIFIKPSKVALVQVPTGSFRMDCSGHVVTSTLPASFAAAHAGAIGAEVANAFLCAEHAQVALSQLTIEYAAVKLLARKMPHGLMIFLAPKTTGSIPEPDPQAGPTT